MERIRTKLLDESAQIKKSEEAKKQRNLKKYGKQIQMDRIKERAKDKRDMLDSIKSLKRSELEEALAFLRILNSCVYLISLFRTRRCRDDARRRRVRHRAG